MGPHRRRIGVYGGTFDPPHNGHRLIAAEAVRALGLDELLVICSGTPPFKTTLRSAALRLELCAAAFGGLDRVTVDAREVTGSGVSYTVDTVEAVAAEHPDADVYLVVGVDAAEQLPTWRDADRLVQMCTVAVARRNGRDGTGVHFDAGTDDLSSTAIRDALAAGRSCAQWLPAEVLEHIAATGAYLDAGTTTHLKLRTLELRDEAQARAMRAELADAGYGFARGLSVLEFAAFLEVLERERTSGSWLPGRVAQTVLVGVIGDIIVGSVSVRHALNDALVERGGHIGYGVRPGHRRRGVATALLRGGLELAAELGITEALLTCSATNVGSRTVIERAGGVRWVGGDAPSDQETLRFWVPTR